MGDAGAGREEGSGGCSMSGEMRLVDADELRRRIEAERDELNTLAWRCAIEAAVDALDAMPSVTAPKGWTRDEVLAELAKHPDNVCEHLDYYTGKWTPSVAVTGWGNPDVPRTNVRVVRSTPDSEWVPLTKLVGRTIHGCDRPVNLTPTYWDGVWRWYDGSHWHPFPDGMLNLDDATVAVRPEAVE